MVKFVMVKSENQDLTSSLCVQMDASAASLSPYGVFALCLQDKVRKAIAACLYLQIDIQTDRNILIAFCCVGVSSFENGSGHMYSRYSDAFPYTRPIF